MTTSSFQRKIPWPRFRPLKIGDVFRYLDWMSISLYVLVLIFSPSAPAAIRQLFLPNWVCYISLIGLFGLSFVFPQQWKLWQRQLYVVASFILLILALASGWSFDISLYILIAKSCFLFSRRDLAIFLICNGPIWTALQTWCVYQFTSNYDKYSDEFLKSQQGASFVVSVVGNVGGYLVAIAFVMLMSFVILQEQRSRAKAERLAAEVEVLAATVERSRIAREIHDSLGHRLTTLDVQLELAQKLQSRDPDRASQSVSIAKQLAHQCLQDVRHAVHSMANESFDLNAAIQTLVQPMLTHPELHLEIRTEFPVLSATLSHQIYCIIQEGLTNIQRHSRASRVELQGYSVDRQIHISLCDDGIGFNLDQASQGFGLRSMGERAQLIGGHLILDSIPSKGTQIYLTIPQA